MEIDAGQQRIEIDVERQQKAKEYARKRRRLSIVEMVIAAIGIFFVLFSGFGIWLRNLVQPLNWQPLPGWFPWQVLVYFLILMLGYQIITTPLGFYSGFVLSHRYGLSTQTLAGWLADLFKGLVLSLILEAFVIELIYLLLATQPQTWWLWVALVLLFFSVVMANLAPVLILPLFYKFTPLPEGELTQRLIALAQRANTRVRGVFTMHLSSKTTAANAAVMGLGNTRRIVLGDTMLDRAIFGLIVMPIGNGYSRLLEDQADEYALQATRKVEAFKRAMTRLANQNLAEVEPSALVEFLFHSHPSVRKRLKHADEFATRYDLKASISEESSAPASSTEPASTEPAGMPSNGSSTPDTAH